MRHNLERLIIHRQTGVVLTLVAFWMIAGLSNASANTLIQAEDGLDLNFILTIDEPSNNQATVVITVNNVSTDEFWLAEPMSVEGYAINVLELEAKDIDGNILTVEHFPGTSKFDPFGDPDQWKIHSQGLSELTIEYTITPKIMEWWEGKPYYGYISDDFAVFLAEYVFLLPPRYISNFSVTVSFNVPQDWLILTPWPQQNGVYNPLSLPMRSEYSTVFQHSVIGLGRFDLYTKTIGTAEVPVAFTEDWSTKEKEDVSQKVWDIFSYQSSVWGNSLDPPYIVIFIPRYAPDGRMIFGGMSQTGQLIPASVDQVGDPNFWFDPVNEIYEARWLSYDWGIVDGSCNWYTSGHSIFYTWKSLIHTRICNSTEAETRIHLIYDYYVTDYANTGKDLPLASPEADADKFLGFWKGSLVSFLLAKEIYLQTNGTLTIDDFDRLLFEKYGFKQAWLQEEDLKSELFILTGIDFTHFFDNYVYGMVSLPMDWAFEDDDGDGLSNALEICWDTHPEDEDTDDDGFNDAEEVGYGSDPLDPSSHPPLVCIYTPRRVFHSNALSNDSNLICVPLTLRVGRDYYPPILPIEIDGEGQDWRQYYPAATDSQGDTIGGAETDMKAVFIKKGPYYVYFMVEAYDPPLLYPGTIELYMDVVDKHKGVQHVGTNINSDGSFWMDFSGEFKIVQDALISWGNVMELRIPMKVLGYPIEVKFVNSHFWVDVEGVWTSVDEIRP